MDEKQQLETKLAQLQASYDAARVEIDETKKVSSTSLIQLGFSGKSSWDL